MPAWSPMALMVMIAFMVSCVSLVLCPMLYPSAVCLPIMHICMHGLLCLPSLLRALIMLGLLLYMLGISCLPGLFGLLCLPGLLRFVLISCACYGQPSRYVWPSLVFYGCLVFLCLLCAFVQLSYVCLWFPTWLCLSGHLPAWFMSSWSPGPLALPGLLCIPNLLCASLHGLLCLLCLIFIF